MGGKSLTKITVDKIILDGFYTDSFRVLSQELVCLANRVYIGYGNEL